MTPMETISSRDNQRLVRVRKIRGGDNSDHIFIEGRRLAEEAIGSGLDILEAFVSSDFADEELLERIGGVASTAVVSSKLFGSIADTSNSQGIILIAERPGTGGDLRELPCSPTSSGAPLFIFLQEVSNPLNLGAIVRTADAAGVSGLIVSPASADVYSPKAIRAAMGSSFRLPICENVGFDKAVVWAKDAGIQVVATEPTGGTPHSEVDWKAPSLVVFGSEAHGLTRKELDWVDKTVTIPLAAGVESLNLAVSAGVLLFEARRQNNH